MTRRHVPTDGRGSVCHGGGVLRATGFEQADRTRLVLTPGAGLGRPPLEPLVPLEVWTLGEASPDKVVDLGGSAALDPASEREVVEAAVAAHGVVAAIERSESTFDPGEGLISTVGIDQHLGDLHVVVGVRQVQGQQLDPRVDVACSLRKVLPHLHQVEVAPLGARPLRLTEGLPPFVRQPLQLGEPIVAEHVGVAVRGVVEDVPLAVDVEGEQPPSERNRIGPSDLTRPKVDPLEFRGDLGEPAR
ncbi:MAG: hypothetical protein U5K29_14965 [Acidimicrobiales bacterium]|nr:hypothetical protein [Acidimicrobiales bacterium]